MILQSSDYIGNISKQFNEKNMIRETMEDEGTELSRDEKRRSELSQLFRYLRMQATYGMKYYDGTDGPTNRRFYGAYSQLLGHLVGGVESGVDYLLQIAALFDLDPTVPGSGYRSIVLVVEKCCVRLVALCRHIRVNRESYLFRATHYSQELDAFVTTLGQLRACLYYLRKLASYCRAGELFADEESLSAEEYGVAERLMMEVESLCQESFYGRCLGFQFCESMVRPLTTINVVMASYGDGYSCSSGRVMRLATSVISSGKYMMSPELRAKQVVNMTRNSDIHFCKAFWALGENLFMHKVPLYMCPSVAVDRVISIAPEPIVLPLVNTSGTTTIRPPSAFGGIAPVSTRLISSTLRSGQADAVGVPSVSVRPPSPYLIIHCHGGGFVAQSSASHEVYLRHWAADLDAPILSVDYSLAPEHQYPRQLEEVFFTYCWALNNAAQLGSTGEKICLVGDSAGGNLAVSVAMKAAACGIRVPAGVVSIYGCLLIKYTPSPSRILALMDPLVPLGALSMCLGAYAGLSTSDASNSDSSQSLAASLGAPAPDGPYCHTAPLIHGRTTSSFEVGTRTSEQPLVETVHEKHLRSLIPSGELSMKRRRQGSGDSGICDWSDVSTSCGIGCNGEISVDTSTSSCGDRCSTNDNEGVTDDVKTMNCDGKEINGSQCSPVLESDENSEGPMTFKASQSQSRPANFGGVPLGRITDVATLSKSASLPVVVQSGVSPTQSPSHDECFKDIATFANLRHFAQSPMLQSKRVQVSKSPYMSPFLAPDELLFGLPPIHLIACQLDPMLDDSVMFARRMQSINRPVRLDLLADLPHGFLNFALISAEAKNGSDRCVSAIRNLLGCGGSSADGKTQKTA